jgi:hypothetical protein
MVSVIAQHAVIKYRELVEHIDKLLSRKRYMGDHWDNVIIKYRETEIREPPPHVMNTLSPTINN